MIRALALVALAAGCSSAGLDTAPPNVTSTTRISTTSVLAPTTNAATGSDALRENPTSSGQADAPSNGFTSSPVAAHVECHDDAGHRYETGVAEAADNHDLTCSANR